ncbi:BEL1-like homeodomain protein 1 [Senna tora]|uniref:BEL1-like homeodomain protein 1 n=1 Tax=Senna tora TaxID=362788 RepID=A0A834TL79_9FABA|nr:BEL1-like homeodomain protein 1 [Senna tora]
MLLQNPNPNDSPPLLDALNPHAPSSSSSSSAFLPLGSHDFSGFHAFAAAPPPPPRTLHYNLWPSSTSSINIDHHQPATASTSSAGGGAGDMSPHMSFRRPSQQGLSLSLSSQQQTAYRPSPSSLSGELDAAAMSGGGDVVSFVLGSKYLKAAQEVLDEVVNVGKGIIQKSEYSIEGGKIGTKANRESTSGGNRDGSSSVGGGENSGNNNNNNGKQEAEVAPLTTAQRQELQMKKSKLISMLDEVEQRYRQYEQEMRIVISSFEQAAGYGGAKTYTSLALKTISKQFRCLKDAIASQVRATSKSLGEEECWLGAKVEGSRLKYVDHHLRQHRALQQIGMMQPNAWRPQRGLPERAVSILRAWLFEHFLHPYPKDSDKVMLAKQTGLTRSQVSNWFINARVRLWKPMVEEMYMEEMKDDQDGSHRENSSAGKEVAGPSTNNNIKEPSQLPQDHPSGGSGGGAGFIHNIHHHHHHDMQITSPKKARTSSTTSEMMMMHNTPSSILSSDANMNHHGFSMEDIGRFNNVVVDHHQLPPTRFHHQHANNNAVSLTLGLPHTPDNNISSLSHGFLSSHNINLGSDHHDATSEFCGINTSHSSTTSNYESNNIDIQNRKRFAAQLLPDFVS